MNEEIRKKYSEVGGILDDALNSAKSAEIEGEEENAALNKVKSDLEKINESFKAEISKLESSSEWDKLCIAYFGETNAGKSTIIESLRIIYDEEKRMLEKSEQDKEFKTILSKHSEEYGNLLRALEDVNDALKKSSSKAAKIKEKIVKGKELGIILFAVGLIIGIVFF